MISQLFPFSAACLFKEQGFFKSNHRRRCLFMSVLVLLLIVGSRNSRAELETHTLHIGETRVLSHPGVRRVVIGNSQVLNAVAAEGRDVLVFGRAEGATSVHVWANSEHPTPYLFRVLARDTSAMKDEVEALLACIPGARSVQIGPRLLIEGDDLSEEQHTRIATLAAQYPAILNFTDQTLEERMVLLDVQVVEVPVVHLREWGLRWDGTTQGGVQAGLAWEAGATNRLARPTETVLEPTGPVSNVAGYFGVNALLSARLAALAQRGEAVLLARPQLLARNGTSATFLAGGEVPYASTDTNGNATTIFKPYGVSLRMTPHIHRNNVIRALIEVEASSVDASLNLPNGPALRIRRATTEFNVHSGATLLIGGFLSREQSTDVSGLPGLKNIPILGALFSSRRFQHRETELAIFVTPRIVSHQDPESRDRVERSRGVVDKAFPQASRLGIAVPGAAHTQRMGWNPYEGVDSQWQRDNTMAVERIQE